MAADLLKIITVHEASKHLQIPLSSLFILAQEGKISAKKSAVIGDLEKKQSIYD